MQLTPGSNLVCWALNKTTLAVKDMGSPNANGQYCRHANCTSDCRLIASLIASVLATPKERSPTIEAAWSNRLRWLQLLGQAKDILQRLTQTFTEFAHTAGKGLNGHCGRLNHKGCGDWFKPKAGKPFYFDPNNGPATCNLRTLISRLVGYPSSSKEVKALIDAWAALETNFLKRAVQMTHYGPQHAETYTWQLNPDKAAYRTYEEWWLATYWTQTRNGAVALLRQEHADLGVHNPAAKRDLLVHIANLGALPVGFEEIKQLWNNKPKQLHSLENPCVLCHSAHPSQNCAILHHLKYGEHKISTKAAAFLKKLMFELAITQKWVPTTASLVNPVKVAKVLDLLRPDRAEHQAAMNAYVQEKILECAKPDVLFYD